VEAGAELLRRVVTLGTLQHVKVQIHRCETHLGCLHRVVDVGLAGDCSRRRTTPRGLRLRRLFLPSAEVKDGRTGFRVARPKCLGGSRWDSVDAASEGILGCFRLVDLMEVSADEVSS
jgi:hypothetical protein